MVRNTIAAIHCDAGADGNQRQPQPRGGPVTRNQPLRNPSPEVLLESLDAQGNTLPHAEGSSSSQVHEHPEPDFSTVPNLNEAILGFLAENQANLQQYLTRRQVLPQPLAREERESPMHQRPKSSHVARDKSPLRPHRQPNEPLMDSGDTDNSTLRSPKGSYKLHSLADARSRRSRRTTGYETHKTSCRNISTP